MSGQCLALLVGAKRRRLNSSRSLAGPETGLAFEDMGLELWVTKIEKGVFEKTVGKYTGTECMNGFGWAPFGRRFPRWQL